MAVLAAATPTAEDPSPETMVAANGPYVTTFLIDTGAWISLVGKDSYKGQPLLSKQLVSIVGVNGKITNHPLVRAKLILSNGQTICLTLLLGSRNVLGMDVLKSQSWVDLWGKWEIGTPPPLPHRSPPTNAPLTVNVLQTAVPLPHSKLVNIPQYKLCSAAIRPVMELIKELDEQGIIVTSHFPYNSPLGPVKKPNGKWRLTVDYRALNTATEQLTAAVPSINHIVSFLNEQCPALNQQQQDALNTSVWHPGDRVRFQRPSLGKHWVTLQPF